ncbi:MAG: 5'-nucleotidase SurE [Gemmatimonadota bacterium]|nr:MAG: 5'-nucleotidase SurE [Gemmatimonadota bacterium]
MRILLSNDDGIFARGLRTLRQALLDAGHHVSTVAPDREQSASSHSITLERPLRIREHGNGEWAVDGTPTDCVLVAVNGLLPERPELVVSGINHGPNMGEDVTYSGTVAAAFEAHILGIPSVATSMKDRDGGDYEAAGRFVARLVQDVERWSGDGRGILNVNFPAGPGSAWGDARITRLGTRRYSDELIEKEDPRGRKYYWIGGAEPTWEGNPDTDFAVVNGGAVSMTPLNLELTDERALEALSTWNIGRVTS